MNSDDPLEIAHEILETIGASWKAQALRAAVELGILESLEERRLPALAPGLVRVEMILAGVCGTDLGVLSMDPESRYIRCSAPIDIGPEGVSWATRGSVASAPPVPASRI